jgi:hypothetical protein
MGVSRSQTPPNKLFTRLSKDDCYSGDWEPPRRLPLLFQVKHVNPALHVKDIQLAALWAKNACCILQLPIRATEFRPPQFGNEHVLG